MNTIRGYYIDLGHLRLLLSDKILGHKKIGATL